jgi:hypothetical protein
MAKTRHVTLNIEEEWLKSLAALAGTFGVSAEEVIRQSLPEEAVVGLFFQCKDYLPELRWDQVAEVGRQAIRGHLRATYREGLDAHLARLGISLEGSRADEVEAARQRALDELRADTERPLHRQIAQAEQDSVYLGWLYDAWRRANAGEPGYTIARVESNGASNGSAWAVLRDNQIV